MFINSNELTLVFYIYSFKTKLFIKYPEFHVVFYTRVTYELTQLNPMETLQQYKIRSKDRINSNDPMILASVAGSTNIRISFKLKYEFTNQKTNENNTCCPWSDICGYRNTGWPFSGAFDIQSCRKE